MGVVINKDSWAHAARRAWPAVKGTKKFRVPSKDTIAKAIAGFGNVITVIGKPGEGIQLLTEKTEPNGEVISNQYILDRDLKVVSHTSKNVGKPALRMYGVNGRDPRQHEGGPQD